MACWIWRGSRTSTATAAAWPPASWISRATVVIVEAGELGSGGKGIVCVASEIVFAASITVVVVVSLGVWEELWAPREV